MPPVFKKSFGETEPNVRSADLRSADGRSADGRSDEGKVGKVPQG